MTRQNNLRDAMLSLLANPAFEAFMAELGEMKNQAVRDSVHDDVIGQPNKMLACAGEIRAYLSIMDLYQTYRDQQQIVVDEAIQE